MLATRGDRGHATSSRQGRSGAPALVGGARLAAMSRPLTVLNDVDYRVIECRSCLNRNQNERLTLARRLY